MEEVSFYWRELVVHGGLWVLFGLQHSGMASFGFKSWWTARLGVHASWERLIFNLVSLFAALVVMVHGHWALPATPLFQPPGGVVVALWGLQGVGVVITGWAMLSYDLGRFAGLSQIRAARRGEVLAEEPLVFSWLHQWVRHPIYTGLLLVIWCRPFDMRTLATNLFATLYLLVGVVLEERKLVVVYGEGYRQLQRRVPCLIPGRRGSSPVSS